MKKIQFTRDGYEKIKKEYEELVGTKRQQVIERLARARAMGDLSENSEYTAAKEELAFVEGRIQELTELMSSAEIVVQENDTHSIDIGCRVILEKNGTQEEFMLVGEFEADPLEKKLSLTSPIGQALKGKSIGSEIEIEVPVGKIKYKVVDIRKV
ncbi:transcription elongation factor GreA [Candidatus Roizmanbacteria bacterium]|nr:transcription elongation factor GreA [Candidatus Roizmanbacteria bacterium]